MRSMLALVAILLFVGCDLRGESQRRSNENNLKQIELALKNYEKSHRKVEDSNRYTGVPKHDSVLAP